MSAKEDLARSQAQNQNMRMEKELLKSSEGRLLQEIESLRRERHSQTMLMANLEAIKVDYDGLFCTHLIIPIVQDYLLVLKL